MRRTSRLAVVVLIVILSGCTNQNRSDDLVCSLRVVDSDAQWVLDQDAVRSDAPVAFEQLKDSGPGIVNVPCDERDALRTLVLAAGGMDCDRFTWSSAAEVYQTC